MKNKIKKVKIKKVKVEKDTLDLILMRLGDNFHYNITYDADYYNPCNDGSDCCDNDYCRCGVYRNVSVTEIDLREIINSFCELANNDIDKYCIDRLLTHSKIKENSSWEPRINGGYYGEEFDGFGLYKFIKDDLSIDLTELFKLDDCNKIKFCLTKEYGYVLPQLNNLKNVKIEKNVSLDSIIKSNMNHVRKLNSKYIDQYKDYKLPAAVCTYYSNKFNLIDGYHRLIANKNTCADVIILY